MEKLAMTVPELAESLGISRHKAYDLTHAKDFPVLVIGKKRVIPVAALHKWLEERAGNHDNDRYV